MTITAFEIYQYSLALQRPFVVDGQALFHREGLMIRVILANGLSGVGEIAPLPGYSRELLKKALFQAKEAGIHLVKASVPLETDDVKRYFQSDVFVRQSPSVRFGFEMALVHLLSVIKKQLPSKTLGCDVSRDVPSAGLLQGTVEEIKSQADALLTADCRTFKLKVGSKNIPLDVKKFHALRDLIGPQKKIRLDANQAWSLTEAVAFARSASKEGVEFIEEPVKNAADLSDFIRETGFPVALDESLWDGDPDTFILIPGVDFLIIKPMVIGGIFQSLRWLSRAGKENKQGVISSCFESGAGARILANLAQFSVLDAGLGTREWFKEDVMAPLSWKEPYRISVNDLNFHWEDLRHQQLSRIL